MTDMRRFIERMPKAELHVHVEGKLRGPRSVHQD